MPSPLLTHNPFSPLASHLIPRLSLQVLIQIELGRRLRKLTQINWNKIYGTLLIRLRHRIPSILKFPRISTDFRIDINQSLQRNRCVRNNFLFLLFNNRFGLLRYDSFFTHFALSILSINNTTLLISITLSIDLFPKKRKERFRRDDI